MRYFFYGTLMDAEVLGAVIGRRIPAARRRSAVLHGYRRVYRAGAWYPILVADTNSRVEGVLVSGLAPADAARLIAFEGNEYDRAEAPVTSARGEVALAHVFFPVPGVPGSTREWTFQEWRRKHRREYVRRARTSCPRGTNWL